MWSDGVRVLMMFLEFSKFNILRSKASDRYIYEKKNYRIFLTKLSLKKKLKCHFINVMED